MSQSKLAGFLFALATISLPVQARQVNFLFADAGRPACEIVVPVSASETTRYAVSRLQSVISEVSGLKVPVVSERQPAGSGGRVLIGTLAENITAAQFLREKRLVVPLEDREKHELKRSLISENLGDQGFVIYAGRYQDQPTLALTAHTPLAVLYAVETLSDRIYRDGERVLAGPLNSTQTPILNLPAFRYRSIATNLGGPDWLGGGQWEKEWAKPDGSGYDWRGFVDWMVSHKINNLNAWIFSLAFGIAYDSKRFPDLVNRHHPNVKHEFMTELIDYAHSRGVSVFVMIDFPDNWTAVVKRYPELAGKNFDPKQIPDGPKWELYQKLGETGGESFRNNYSWVCGSEPKTMEFWRNYLEDLLERYPKLDGIGGQFSEWGGRRCDCDRCYRNHFAILERFFAAMVDVGRRWNSNMKFWVYSSWGTRDIVLNQDRYPNFINIDWSGAMAPLARRQYIPRSRWYLFHRGRERFSEFSYKYAASSLNYLGLEGMEIRVPAYKMQDNRLQAFEEFGWNPGLTIDEYAQAYIRKLYRRHDPQLTELYAAWLKLLGYQEFTRSSEDFATGFYESPNPDQDRARFSESTVTVRRLLDQITSDVERNVTEDELVVAIKKQFEEMGH